MSFYLFLLVTLGQNHDNPQVICNLCEEVTANVSLLQRYGSGTIAQRDSNIPPKPCRV